jgi:hypothetical protein
MLMEPVRYSVDAQDRLEAASPGWDRFATANGGEAALWERVRGRSLWDFVADRTTRGLYKDLLARARGGRAVSFPFRCDSPDARRFLVMEMRPAGEGRVEFLVRARAVEPRPPVPLPQERPGGLLRACGWCRRVAGPGGWLEVEDAVRELGLFEAKELPAATHGICARCEDEMVRVLDARSQYAPRRGEPSDRR